ncbi:MAG: DNA polymerase III subunit delta [Oscillospiraceae bacterium]|nr:DNA polymerase III subunit delta [Oscillospiraceae bacterium]
MKKDSRNIIKQQIADKNMSHIYLLFGEEDFLKDEYAARIKKAVYGGDFPEFNSIVLPENAGIAETDSAFETCPMMSDTKFILIKDSGIFSAPKLPDEIREFWKKRLADVPEYTYAVFVERNADKRGTLYKTVSKNHTAAEFPRMNSGELTAWTERKMLTNKRMIKKEDALYICALCSNNLMLINSECDKLISYTSETVSRGDIDRVVSKSPEIRIFDITDGIIEGDPKKVLQTLDDLNTQNTSALQILYILSGTFDKMLQCRLMLEDAYSVGETAAALSLPEFIAKKYISGAKRFDTDFLESMIIRTAETDLSIKQGRMSDRAALDRYVIEGLRSFKK